MNYIIRELDGFSVIGQEIELTNSTVKNIQISIQFWKTFNMNLKKTYLSQGGNWIKYAFMRKKNDKLFYYCAIPKRNVTPDTFIYQEISPSRYLVVEHKGFMAEIYKTYKQIYGEIIPNTGYKLIRDNFLHFEKYDYRFHWNREDSIIEIWVPVIE